ncbi:MAG TPA: ArsR family transcriptional regulator [Conexivisphaerales archaeon]|nr:ArsR family transcriptional regulator [Conexivisphaerales archaeon]
MSGTAELLLRTLLNPTKLSVIVLLSDNEPLTVTQMAKAVKVSRANLYHFVSEMVGEGLLIGPESRVKKNYVEKYYRLNSELLEGSVGKDWEATLRSAKPEAFRDLLRSLFVSFSMQFRIMAEQLAGADSRMLSRLDKLREKHLFLGVYSVLPDDRYASVVKELTDVLVSSDERGKEDEGARGRNKLIVVAMPDLSPGGKG